MSKECTCHLTGSLSVVETISGALSLGSTAVPVPPYKGVYDLTPLWEEQRLATEGKLMTKDVRVYKIPLYKTSNPSGGETVIIGG